MVYRTDANGIRRVARDHPLYFVLHDSPNFDQTAVDFWEYMAAGIELQGNAYALIERRTSDNAINALHPIRPDLVRVRRLGDGSLEYEWTEDGRRVVKSGEQVLHIRGAMGDGLSAPRPSQPAGVYLRMPSRLRPRPGRCFRTELTLAASCRLGTMSN